LPAPTMSHLICTGALIVLIFAIQFSYVYVVDNLWAEMVERQLKEIADYVSDTLANLYFLANSTSSDITLEKVLSLPSDVRGSTYWVEIEKNATTGFANKIYIYLARRSRIDAASWLLPGLMRDENAYAIESGGKSVVAGCSRVTGNVYVRIVYG